MSTQQPQPHAVAQLAVQYFEAVLTKDSATLTDVYGYSKQDCDAVSPEQQQQAAAKLLAVGNILARKTQQQQFLSKAPPLAGKQTTVTPASSNIVTKAQFFPTVANSTAHIKTSTL